jgi:hypothetical protein
MSAKAKVSTKTKTALKQVTYNLSDLENDLSRRTRSLRGGAHCESASLFPPIKMGDREAPVAPEFKYLGSMLSKKFDDSVTIMARIRSHEDAEGYFRDEARCA